MNAPDLIWNVCYACGWAFGFLCWYLSVRGLRARVEEYRDRWLESEKAARDRTDNASVEAYRRMQKDRERLILMLKRFSSEWDENLDAALKSLRSERPDETFQNIRTEQP